MAAAQALRTCFQLEPPPDDAKVTGDERVWTLRFLLQAADDPIADRPGRARLGRDRRRADRLQPPARAPAGAPARRPRPGRPPLPAAGDRAGRRPADRLPPDHRRGVPVPARGRPAARRERLRRAGARLVDAARRPSARRPRPARLGAVASPARTATGAFNQASARQVRLEAGDRRRRARPARAEAAGPPQGAAGQGARPVGRDRRRRESRRRSSSGRSGGGARASAPAEALRVALAPTTEAPGLPVVEVTAEGWLAELLERIGEGAPGRGAVRARRTGSSACCASTSRAAPPG